MELISPDGKTTMKAHPSKVESLLNRGWKEVKPPKASKKKEVVEQTDEAKESE